MENRIILYEKLTPIQTFGLVTSASNVSLMIENTYRFYLEKLGESNIEMKVEQLFFDLQKHAISDLTKLFPEPNPSNITKKRDVVKEFLNKYNIIWLVQLQELIDKDEQVKIELIELNNKLPYILKFSGFYRPINYTKSYLEPTGDTYLFMEEHGKLYSRLEILSDYVQRCDKLDSLKDSILHNMVTHCYWAYVELPFY